LTLKNFFVGIFKFAAHVFLLMLVGALSTFITLRFFTSGDEVAVPDLTGKDAPQAIEILGRQSLQLKIMPQKRFSDKIAENRVVIQVPEKGTKIKKGRSIEVYLSLGPEKIVVPDVTGQTARVANLTLSQRGLNQGKLIYVSNPSMDSDQVLAQFPMAGTEMIGARTVNLVVNGIRDQEKVYVMPDLIGQSFQTVRQSLREAGLRLGSSQEVDYPGIPEGTIVKQTPPAGYKVSGDTLIGLYYSK
jgi:eukaryotic-like serine/threonine-protein kinase